MKKLLILSIFLAIAVDAFPQKPVYPYVHQYSASLNDTTQYACAYNVPTTNELQIAIANIPATGGVLDSTCYTGAQDITSDIWSSVSTNIIWYAGSQVYTVDANATIPSNFEICFGPGGNIVPGVGFTLTNHATACLGGGGTGPGSCAIELTQEGALLYYHNGACAELTIGPSGYSLQSTGTDPFWGPQSTSTGGCSPGTYLDNTFCATPQPDVSTNAVQVVQSNSTGIVEASNANLPSPTTLTVTLPGNTIAGDQIAVKVLENTSAVSPNNSFAITDSQGNAFTQYGSTVVSDVSHAVIAVATTAVNGPDEITVVYTATGGSPAQNIFVFAEEYQNLGAFEQASGSAISSDGLGTVSITTTHNNDTVTGIFGGVSSSTGYAFNIANSSWNSIPISLSQTASGSNQFAAQSAALNAPTAQAYSLTLNVANLLGDASQVSTVLWSFQNASSASNTGTLIPRLQIPQGASYSYYFASLSTLQDGFKGYCIDCDVPSAQGSSCTSSGAKAGAAFEIINEGPACFGRNVSSSGGVTSLNSLTGALTLIAGSGIGISPGSGTLTFTATGGGGGITLQTLGSNNADQALLNFIASSTDTAGFHITPSNSVGTEKFEITALSQSAYQVFGNFSGSSGVPGFGSLVGAMLPTPGASSLGGVEAITCTTNEFVNQISTGGVPSCGTPSGAAQYQGTATMPTSAINSAANSSVVSVAVTGVTPNQCMPGFTSTPASVPGFVASTSGILSIFAYPSAGFCNFYYQNNTATNPLTPGALTLHFVAF